MLKNEILENYLFALALEVAKGLRKNFNSLYYNTIKKQLKEERVSIELAKIYLENEQAKKESNKQNGKIIKGKINVLEA